MLLGCEFKPSSIIGGSEADPISVSWQVGLLFQPYHGTSFGETLLSDRHVLTAAHCMYNYDIHGDSTRPKEYYEVAVVVKEHDRFDTSDGIRHALCR